MNTIRIVIKSTLAGTAAALMASCGGGGDATGGTAAFNIVPAEITVRGRDNLTCGGGGSVGQVFVFGGAAPYKIFNTSPDFLVVNQSSVGAPGGYFEVVAPFEACSDSLLIVVQDQVGRQTTLTVKSVKGTDPPAPPASAPTP